MTLPATFTALFIAFALTILAPTNVAAQQSVLRLGTVEGINLNLIFPVTLNDHTTATTDDKLYYFLDHNDSGNADGGDGDGVTGNMVDALFNNENGGADVFATQETDTMLLGAPGNHDESDDERSVIIGNYVLVLPTVNELHALSVDQGNSLPTDWAPNDYRTATPADDGSERHRLYFFHSLSINASDANRYRLAVQVILLPVSAPTAAPTAVTASPTTDGTLRIDWTAVPEADNGGTPILTYTATATNRSDNSDATTCTADGTATTCTITGLTNGTIYDIAVTATNSEDEGPASTAFGVIPGRPAAPTGVMLTPGFEQIIVTWNTVPDTDNGGDAVTGYRIRLFNSPLGGPDVSARDPACTVTAAPYTCTITGLTNGNRYRVVVHATNSRGDSIASPNAYATLSGVFRPGTAIANQTLSVDQPAVTINLPAATEGIAPYTYILTRSDSGTPLLPSGLTFNPAARTISGTPGAAFGVNGGVELVYTATDSDTPTPDIGTLTFRLTVNDDALLLGSVSGINLNLRYPVITADGNVYYYNDHNNSGVGEHPADDVSVGALRNLLNGGNPVPETQSGGHDGTDDERSVLVGAYTLVLPTIADMRQLRTKGLPATWFSGSYNTATNSNNHNIFSFASGASRVGDPVVTWPVAFQVIPVAVLSMADVSVAETAGTATVKVQLTNTVTNGFSVDISTADGSGSDRAIAGQDYTAAAATLNFTGEDGEIQTFSVTIRDDSMDEGRETLTVSLNNLQGTASTVILSDPATIAIIENWLFRIKVFLEGAQ